MNDEIAERLLDKLKGCPEGLRVQSGGALFLAVGRLIFGDDFDARSEKIELGSEFNGATLSRSKALKGFHAYAVNPEPVTRNALRAERRRGAWL